MNTSGFYNYSDGQLTYAPNAVFGPSFALLKEEKDSYTYPANDWYWFDSREAALAFYGITEEENG